MNTKNYISLKLGGKDRGIKFDLGAKEIAAELFKEQGSMSSELRMVSVMLYAGMCSVYEIKDQDLDFTIDDVRKWARRLDTEDLTPILDVWNRAYGLKTEPTSTEEKGDTQQQAA